ncbi:RNaseH domain-containing protein [Burkholderia ubonensis]|uniref:RNaseH domain-containing protein n=1 Tax=Burkholderia ubonensis TaxID=101571 RepID=UPI000755DD6D|nr:RNaseH domain-containing protein [Burkholderia ubonensis]KVN78947.1 hypothetical protein WJ67_12080 [Burkholderia ubonensis]
MTDSMSEEKTITWTRVGGHTVRAPMLIGRKISPEWLKQSVPLVEFSFSGELFGSFSAILTSARQEKKNLPVTSLRTALTAGLDKIVRLDRDLGLLPDANGRRGSAIVMLPDLSEDGSYSATRERIARYLSRWLMNEVEPWAERHKMGGLVSRMKATIRSELITPTEMQAPLVRESDGLPDFPLIVRIIGGSMMGEELFEGLGACELVASPESRSNSIELMSMPRRATRGDDVFSMVARLTVSTMPYTRDLFLGVSAMKRVWAKKVPFAHGKMPRRVTGYVLSSGRPAVTVPVERTKTGWEFGEGYAATQIESGSALPDTLEEAVRRREFDECAGWWAGLPELTTLFRFVSPRTVFEGDEARLLETVSEIVGYALVARPIALREIAINRKKRPLQEMLRLTDLEFGAAGDSLVSGSDAEEAEVEDDESGDDGSAERITSIADYREQNIRALTLSHGKNKPILWVLCDLAREQEIIGNSVQTLFGDAVEIKLEALPAGTHGLRGDLDGINLNARGRFDERVKRWQVATTTIRQVSGTRPVIALICAPDKYNQRNEDSVNYYAGIHAMSSIGANVHHLLPIEAPDDPAAEQAFLHRTQSALLDVFLAHSGIIFGTREFAAQLLPSESMPRCIYGLQAVRSRARAGSGETGFTFLLNTRLVIETGVTEVQFIYKGGKGTQRSEWKPLSAGLQWLGSQRQMYAGDDRWLKSVFEDATRETLLSIHQSDPRAVVMIDWQSVAGLWRGIRDADLTTGNSIRLGSADLANFKDMSFVRLRRGAETLSLRSEVKVTYEGWLSSDERTHSGETFIDAYYSTGKSLVELTEDGPAIERGYGHFMATMGYAKTVQVKRGLSCYRASPRMQQIGKGAKEFTQKMLDPAAWDASLPSSMEITVLRAPQGVIARNVAMLVMGLRIGYAHYDDWTTLPAPLFFRRKIEDYVIRFPDDDDDDPPPSNEASPPDGGGAAEERDESTGAQTFVSRLIENSAKTDSLAAQVEVELPEVNRAAAVCDETDLLALVKLTPMPTLHGSRDLKIRRLGQRMMYQDAGVRVRVELPYWIKTKGIFGEFNTTVRRKATSYWKALRDMGVVRERAPMPRESELLDWMGVLLQVPQSAMALAPASDLIGGLSFRRLHELISIAYNPGRPTEDQVLGHSLNPAVLERLTRWAQETRHDELMGWLIFQVAQYPIGDWRDVVIGNITDIPGPLTEEALKYYLDVASAVTDAIAQCDHLNKFQTILRRRPKPVVQTTSDEDTTMQANESVGAHQDSIAGLPAAGFGQTELHTDIVQQAASSEGAAADPLQLNDIPMVHINTEATETSMKDDNSSDDAVFLNIRSRIEAQVQRLEPGKTDFAEVVAEINESLATLELMHRRALERNNAAQQARQRRMALLERCQYLLSKIKPLEVQLGLGAVSCVENLEDMDIAEESVGRIDVLVGDIEALDSQMKKIESMPSTPVLAERQKRNRIVSETVDSMLKSAEELKGLVLQSPCFTMATDGNTGAFSDIDEDISTVASAIEDIMAQPADAFPTLRETAKLAPTPDTTDSALTGKGEAGQTEATLTEPLVQCEISWLEQRDSLDPGNAIVNRVSTILESDTVVEEGLSKQAGQSLSDGDATHEAVTKTTVPDTVPSLIDLSSDDIEEGLETAHQFIEKHSGVLHRLVGRRLYGLATVHVEAMKPVLTEMASAETSTHYVVLHALVDSLYRMDCQFEFESRLDPALKEMLITQSLAGCSLTDSASVALGVLAAGLASMLFDRSDIQWNIGNAISAPLTGHPRLRALIEHIDTIRQRGLQLTRDMFLVSQIGDQEALKHELQRFQRRAETWKTAPEIYSSWNHRGFKAMHEDMFSPKSPIGSCLDNIARGAPDKVAASYEDAHRKMDKPAAMVDEIFRQLGERTRPDGLYRSRAIENIEVSKRFIESYLDHAQRQKNPNVELVKSTLSFLATLHRRLEDSLLEITAIATRGKLEEFYREAAISAIRCALRLYDDNQSPACIPQEKQKLLIQAPLNRDLMPVLDPVDEYTPALCVPAAILEETGRWADEGLSIGADGDSIDEALKEALRQHLAAQRFVPAFHIDLCLPRSMMMTGDTPVLQLYNQRKTVFGAELQRARQRVTHAMTLSALTQNEANSMQRVIEAMQDSLRPEKGIGHPAADGVIYADFPQAAAVLRHRVLMPLEARLNEVARRLEEDLNGYAETSRGLASSQDIQRIRAMLQSDNAASLRTAHDALALLKATHKLPTRLGGPIDVALHYDQFMSRVHQSVHSNKSPLEALCTALGQPAADNDPDWMKPLSDEDRDEAVKLIKAWLELFVGPRQKLSGDSKQLEAVFHLLGINHAPSTIPEHGRTNRLRFMLPDRSFTFPTTADDEMFIPPVLGSRAVHIQGFMMFGQSTENELRQLMHEIGGTPTVVLARARLNMTRRARVCGAAPALLIDDELVAYVALHPNERLQALMRVGMLSFNTNPYDDYGGRPVPTEMFFGRQVELAKLRDVKSLGVLYGGRRLGKSSLLAQVELETQSTPGMTAVYISMDTIDSSTNHVHAAWGFVYRNLLSRKIIGPMSGQPTQWQQIRDWIEKEVQGRPDLKSIYLLIDEADSLMGRELRLAKGEVGFVRSLQQMVENLHHVCHIRYVIAGLHNMTRMTSEENSVLGKAETIALEPFSSASDIQRGIRLITKPLAAMGFLFAHSEEDLPLRILSVCNFYPAFIQLYCKSLVDRLMNRRQDTRPPLYVTADDLDAVENDSSLLSELRHKFELNLNLDKRYKAIALLLADVYYSQSASGPYSGLTISEISGLCDTLVPTHFANAGPGVYEALLEEMIKLNVLERVNTRYVLRNPNIAMMMGDADRVAHKLDELAKEPPEETRNRGERRVTMDYGTSSIPFPFPVAWVRRYMDSSDGELLVLTGNELSGIVELNKPTGRDEWKIGQDGVYTMMPGIGPMSANDYLVMLRRNRGTHPVRRIVAVRPAAWNIVHIPAFVQVAQKAAKQNLDVRFALLALPERALELAQAVEAKKIDTAGWRVVPLPQWTEDAVYFRLQENSDVSENSDALSALIKASCGFDREVQRVCNATMSVDDALRAPELAKRAFGRNLDEFYRRINLPATFAPERRGVVNSFLETIKGAHRMSTEVDDVREMLGVTWAEMEFLHWMGILQEGAGGTWTVPDIYFELLTSR